VIKALEKLAEEQPSWGIVPRNYEGVRVNCQGEQERGWFLLRLSLHDPVIPLNIESNVKGGVNKIAGSLFEFLRGFDRLDLSAFQVKSGDA
jgi:phosphomannomutase